MTSPGRAWCGAKVLRKWRSCSASGLGGFAAVVPARAGEDYRSFTSQFADIVRHAAKWATVAFRPFFRFYDLQLPACRQLTQGWPLDRHPTRLGHSSMSLEGRGH